MSKTMEFEMTDTAERNKQLSEASARMPPIFLKRSIHNENRFNCTR